MNDLEHLIWFHFQEGMQGAPMHPEHFADCMDHFARVELHGNDGADIWECTEFNEGMALCYGVENSGQWAKILHDMETWVMRAMGPSFDPEKHCPYTGRRLWKFPTFLYGERYVMGYYREPNAYLFRIREFTPAEHAWISGHALAFAASLAKFERWRDHCRGLDSVRPLG